MTVEDSSPEAPEGEFGKFYKYRQLWVCSEQNGEQRCGLAPNTASVIRDQEIYFAHPEQLNDPFELKPYLTWGPGRHDDAVRAEMAAGITRHAPHLEAREVDALVAARFERMATDEFERHAGFWSIAARSTGIFSLSRRVDSALQWAYYGQDHSGVCLEFTRTPETDYTQFFPVHYTDERPPIDLKRMLVEPEYCAIKLFEAVTTKARVWEHEDEVRMLWDSYGAREFPRDLLTGVYFGMTADREAAEAFCSLLVESSFEDLPIYSMAMRVDTYAILPVPIGTAGDPDFSGV